jgi:hypothetical protein
MNLKEALEAIAPVVGDGKLIPQHAYLLAKDDVLHATDGRQWVEVTLPPMPPPVLNFCVRYEPLRKALERTYLSVVTDNDNGLIVRYGRGRARLRGIDPASFPMLEKPPITSYMTLPSYFQRRVKDLMTFCADGDGHVWQQAVHINDNFMFAANSFALALCQTDWGLDFHPEMQIGIPTWACKFIANMKESPVEFRQRGQMISFKWPDVELFTTLLTQEPPTNIINFASNITEPTTPVPDGLKEAVKRIDGYGGRTCKIGNGEITYGTDAVELVDALEINGSPKTWGIDTLNAALEHATALDLSGSNATWAGEGYVGVFGGRSD